MHRPFLPHCTLLLYLLLVGCSGRRADQDSNWRGEIVTLDHRTLVRNQAGSVWRAPARLEEFLIIGRDERSMAEVLIDVRGIAVLDERIFILDLQEPMLREFGFDGILRNTFGQEGDGPGELRRPTGLALDPEAGRLFVRDGVGARINVYDLDGGTLETRRIPWTRPFLSPLVICNGRPWTEAVLTPGVPSSRWQTGMVACAPDGSPVDTLAIPQLPYRPLEVIMRTTQSSTGVPIPFSPERIWAMTTEEGMLVGTSDSYRFELHRRDGSELIVEKHWEPRVSIEPDEAAWYRGRTTITMQREDPEWVWNGPELPGNKPAFKYLFTDEEDRIWVVRPGPGRRLEEGVQEPEDWRDYFLKPAWEDSWLLEVFGPDGCFLGPVEVPIGMQFQPRPVVTGHLMFALTVTPDGIPLVTGYRLQIP